jgi:hypothetical protein
MKNLYIETNSKIYVACPSNVATGGPELLHQLVYELRKLGFNAYMYYYDMENNNPIHPAYVKYSNPYVENIEDNQLNILIVPEVKTGLIYDYNKIQKVIWWLSVDNFYKRFDSNILWKKVVKKILFNLGYFKVYRFQKDNNLIHFVQSEYAKQHLLQKGIENIYFLGDYLNELFIDEQLENINSKKQDIVIYNPKKGIEFTKKIIQHGENITFVPIENMTREEVAKLLSTAKVYIDFGNHPGKDRIPREAAISGCCVITGKQGSAKYYEDVAIEEEFKFEDKIENIPLIIKKIKECMNNYDENSIKFNFYRKKIKNEQNNFINDIKKIFTLNN